MKRTLLPVLAFTILSLSSCEDSSSSSSAEAPELTPSYLQGTWVANLAAGEKKAWTFDASRLHGRTWRWGCLTEDSWATWELEGTSLTVSMDSSRNRPVAAGATDSVSACAAALAPVTGTASFTRTVEPISATRFEIDQIKISIENGTSTTTIVPMFFDKQ